jgi:glycerophosphoryl diester phosphodiesterase
VSTPAIVVAHRAGNDPSTMAAAAVHADVVEADVHLFRGRLEVRHAKTLGPIPVLWERWYLLDRGTPRISLEAVLEAAAPDVGLMLDLKGIDPRLPGRVLRAAEARLAETGLFVSSRAWRLVDRLHGAPGVRTLHSVGNRRELRALLRRYPSGALEGVSVHRRLLEPAVVSALRVRAPQVWSWPVDDLATARSLADWGVTGFISDAPHLLQPVRASDRSQF